MPTTISKRFRVILVCLLVLCLSPTVLMTPWLDHLHNSALGSKSVPFITSFAGAASVVSARTRLTYGLDDLLKIALTPGRPLIVFARISFPSLFEDNAGVVDSIDSKAILIRAPPIYLAS
jgi:hypothetical protein